MRSTLLVDTGPLTLTKTWFVNGTATDVGAVTIGIVDANGDEVVAPATATQNNADGTYEYELAIQSQVNVLFVTWIRDDTDAELSDVLEVVASRLFTEAAARAFDEGALVSTATYTDAEISAAHDEVADWLELQTNQSWISRYCRVIGPGPRGYAISLRSCHRQASNGYPIGGPGYGSWVTSLIRANDGGGTDISGAVIDPVRGRIVRTDAAWTRASISSPFNVTLEFAYGRPFVDEGVDRIALLIVRDHLVKSKIPESALAVQGSEGSMQLVQAGGRLANPSRLPEVNAWVNSHRLPAVA